MHLKYFQKKIRFDKFDLNLFILSHIQCKEEDYLFQAQFLNLNQLFKRFQLSIKIVFLAKEYFLKILLRKLFLDNFTVNKII